MIPEGSDAISPAPHHDIYSIEDLRQLVYSLKRSHKYKKPVIVKIAAVHNVAAIASPALPAAARDIIAIDGFRGGTGAAPTRIRDNVGIPIELALAAVDQRLRDEGIRNKVSLVVGGSIRSSATWSRPSRWVRMPATSARRHCWRWAATCAAPARPASATGASPPSAPTLVKRLNRDIGYQRLVNLVTAWKHEIKEMMGGMGINSIEALRGQPPYAARHRPDRTELAILGIAHAGE